jgi:hypothetical protein
MRSLFTSVLPLVALCVTPIAFAQTIAPVLPKSAPQAPAHIAAPDVGKILAQTFDEQDIELITGSLRDALAGKQVDERRMAPLAQKMEGFAAALFREMLTQSLPMIDGLEGELKKELRRLKEAKPQ